MESWINKNFLRSTQGGGPPFTKIGGAVLYPIDKLVEWETRNTVTSTSQYGTKENA